VNVTLNPHAQSWDGDYTFPVLSSNPRTKLKLSA